MLETLKRHAVNIPGWRTNRKIIVFESDDWGSIRMPSSEVYKKMLNSGLNVNKCPYCRNDSLASEKDFELLFNVLLAHKDKNGQSASITANTIVANPDFGKIKANNFTSYYYELFTETLKEYPNHQKSFNYWKQGMKENIFRPQFHGREHLQANRWLKQLRMKAPETITAYEQNLFGVSTTISAEDRESYLAAYDWDTNTDRRFIINAVRDGLENFKNIFGYSSVSAIAPNYIWHPQVEKLFKDCGVRFIQSSTAQRIPNLKNDRKAIKRHYTGQTNALGQIYTIRNCYFEPSLQPLKDWLSNCLEDIKTAFFWKKPAIISSHRVNYMGSIDPQNRDQNLQLLDHLLNKITTKWPEIEFMTTDQLGRLIEDDE